MLKNTGKKDLKQQIPDGSDAQTALASRRSAPNPSWGTNNTHNPPRAATRVTSLCDVQWSANAQKTPVLVPGSIKIKRSSCEKPVRSLLS